MKKRIYRYLPGFLAFLGYYEMVSGLKVPSKFTVGRVTSTYLAQLPLLGGLELDFIAFVLASSLASRIEREKRYRLVHLAIIASTATILLVCRNLEVTYPVYMAIGSASLLSALIHARLRGASTLIPGLLLSTAILEVSSLFALLTYFASGGWSPISLQLVLRERLLWAPIEWASVPIFIVGMWIALVSKTLNRPSRWLLNPPRSDPVDDRDSGGLLILAGVLIALMLILVHLPTVNPEFKPVSVDTANYKILFERIGGCGIMEALRRSPERPLFMILVYPLWRALSGDAVLLMDLVYPLFALTLLTLSSYYAGLKLGGPSTAGWASLLVPLGHAAPAFIGGGFQANSLALTPAILALIVEAKDRGGAYKLSALLTLTALLHPWTYFMYASALTLKNLRDKARLVPTLLAVMVSYFISQVVDYLLGAVIVAEVASRPVTGSWGFYLPTSWFEAVQFYVWNTMSNPLYLILSTLILDPYTSSLMAISAPFTAILPSGLIFRLLLNLPIQLQASKAVRALKPEHRKVILLFLSARALGNLSGLTPLPS